MVRAEAILQEPWKGGLNPSGRTGPGVDSASNKNEYQESLKIKKPVGKVRSARRADNLAAIYWPFV
jgi:hypothetical protein